MAVTSGFFDSINHDRRYTASQFGAIMDYLVTDGVYSYYPDTGVVYDEKQKRNKTLPPFKMSVVSGTDSWKVPTGNGVVVGPGRAWFDHTWTHVSTPEIVTCPPAPQTGDRIDVVVLQMNKTEAVRANRIICKQGPKTFENGNLHLTTLLPAHVPEKGNINHQFFPELQGSYMHGDEVHDVPLAYIYRPVGEEGIRATNIYSCVGLAKCPFVTTIGDSAFSVETVYLNWSEEFDSWWNSYRTKVEDEYTEWYNNILAVNSEWEGFLNERSADFMRWLKMYDRMWHVWYQGSVNFTYEHLRQLDAAQGDFESRWGSVIQKAEYLIENGISEYTAKIEELISKMADIDTLVDEKTKELQDKVDEVTRELEQTLRDSAKDVVSEVIEENIATIAQTVVELAAPDIEQSLREDIMASFGDDIDGIVDEKVKAMAESVQAQVANQVESLGDQYAQVLATMRDDVASAVADAFTSQEEMQEMFSSILDPLVSEYVKTYIGDKLNELVGDDLVDRVQTALFLSPFDETDLNKYYGDTYAGKTFHQTAEQSLTNGPDGVENFSVQIVKTGPATTAQLLLAADGSSVWFRSGNDGVVSEDGEETQQYSAVWQKLYPAPAGEISEAIEARLKTLEDDMTVVKRDYLERG